MTFPMTPQQFSAVTNKLCNTQGIELRPANALSGSLTYRNVTLAYAYDEKGALTVDITAKHGFSKAASDDYIFGQIKELLQNA